MVVVSGVIKKKLRLPSRKHVVLLSLSEVGRREREGERERPALL